MITITSSPGSIGNYGVQSTELDTDSVEKAKVADYAIDTAELCTYAVEANQLNTDSVTNAKVANFAIDTTELVTYAVGTSQLDTYAVDTEQLATFAVESDQLSTDSVVNSKIGDFAVDTTEIATYAVGSDQLNTDSVVNAKIGDFAVDTTEIATFAVDTEQLATYSVETNQLNTDSVTNAKIGNFAVDTAELATDSVTVAKQSLKKQCACSLFFPVAPAAADFDSLGVFLDATGEKAQAVFRPPSFVDASADILITSIFRGSVGDSSLTMKFSVACIKSDNSEAFSWNVESDTAVGLDNTNADNPFVHEYTLANASFDAGDIIYVRWEINEASRDLRVATAQFEFSITG